MSTNEPEPLVAATVDAIETLGKMLTRTAISSVMLELPLDMLSEFKKDTGYEIGSRYVDFLEINFELASGDKQSTYLMLHQVKDLIIHLMKWHDDMHEAGKCEHDK